MLTWFPGHASISLTMKQKNKEPLLKIDQGRHEIFVYGERKHLALKEFKILVFLFEKNKTTSRADLIKAIWSDDLTVDERTVDQHVARMRRKLGFQVVETVPGVGYRIAAL